MEKYPQAFRSLFGRTQATKRRLELSSSKHFPKTKPQRESTPTFTNQDESLADIDQLMDAFPDPPSQNLYNPRAEELSCRDESMAESLDSTIQNEPDTCSASCTVSSVSMKGRKLPPIPGANFQPVPKKVSNQVTKQDPKRKKKPREVRIVEKDLRGLFKGTSSRV